jgi:hypothetical protein
MQHMCKFSSAACYSLVLHVRTRAGDCSCGSAIRSDLKSSAVQEQEQCLYQAAQVELPDIKVHIIDDGSRLSLQALMANAPCCFSTIKRSG